ncbi:sulfite exporter TauE/SafE family protein [Albibacterium profundi]|uniref:Probable membrane transporter protein n=1 Tax=Albibacterium profundi TaxID=3134906 RepID=A0ABV5CAU5_9SPHI
MTAFLLLLLGLIVGGFGTMVGAGGGFILVPVLLLLYPDKDPEVITSISLAVVFLNACSGSIAYAFKKRIDYKSSLLFCITVLPGSVIGAMLTSYISRNTFNVIFGLMLLSLSIILLIKPTKNLTKHSDKRKKSFWWMARYLIDIDGVRHLYRYNLLLGIILSFFVGIISSLFGIGGGVIHVPAMVNLLNFPIHIATATSQFILSLMSLSGTAVHYVKGDLHEGLFQVLYLGIGVIIGAQIGARISTKIKGKIIIQSLALTLLIVALRILWTTIF